GMHIRGTRETMGAVNRSTFGMNQDKSKRFGEWLREQRQAVGLSTIQLADAIGTTSGTISRIELGEITSPDPHKLVRIAQALNIDLADVYAMADYTVPHELPSFAPYLRRKYRDMPDAAVQDLDAAFDWILRKHGYQPDGPSDGEDETPEDEDIN
ncbi:MAG: helix-turn-helix domain-containing protein, partial [Mycobacteriales bacterium]